jgi:PAS domain S-box-containing protein
MTVLAEASTARAVAEHVGTASATAESDPSTAGERASEADCLAIAAELPGAAGAECLLSVREVAPDLPVVIFGAGVDESRGGEEPGRTEYVAGTEPAAIAAGIDRVLSAWHEDDRIDFGGEEPTDVDGLLDQGTVAGDTFERSPEPTVEYDHEDGRPRVVGVNAAFASTFGVRAAAVVGDPLDEVVFNVGGGDHTQLLAGEPVEAELRCRTVEGVRTFLLRTRPPTDAEPGVAVYTDISDYKSVEERYSALVQSSSDTLFILDRQGIVDYVSPAVTEVFGHEPDDLEGYPLTEYVHPEDRETVGDLLSDPTGWAGETRSITYRFRAEEGWRTVESAARSRLYDPAVEGVVMNCRDVTERERYERELERQNARLEEFASVVSHDLRNPLNVARGHLQNARLGLAGEVDLDPAESLAEVETSMDRMETLIGELLTLARRGEDVEDPDPVALSTVWEAAVSTVDTDGVETAVEGDVVLLADEARLRRVFENLLRNAVDHAGEGTVVRLGLLAVDGDGTASDAGRLPGFYVADDGPGIPPEERERVFEPRYSTRSEGTGLGLSIVRRVVDAHGWTVQATESGTGGARFEVTGVEVVDDATTTDATDEA